MEMDEATAKRTIIVYSSKEGARKEGRKKGNGGGRWGGKLIIWNVLEEILGVPLSREGSD